MARLRLKSPLIHLTLQSGLPLHLYAYSSVTQTKIDKTLSTRAFPALKLLLILKLALSTVTNVLVIYD